MQITVIRGDITQVHADVIVNAANRRLRGGGGGVDGAIHKAAGPDLLAFEEWMYPHGTQVAEPVATPAFDLPARHIVHVPGPDVRELHKFETVWSVGTMQKLWHRVNAELWNAYGRSLVLAGLLGARTVTFPSLSTGIFAFPLDRAVPIAIDALRTCADRAPSVHTVAIVAFDAETADAFKAAMS